MGYRSFIITRKDFAKYGIEEHYDLDALIDGSPKRGKALRKNGKKKNKRAKKTLPFTLGGGDKKKGTSSIKGKTTGRIIKGHASTYDKDRAKDVITRSAMKEAVNDLLQPGANTVFLNHDTDKAIGRVLKTKLDKKGLFVEIMISKAGDVEDVWIKLEEGILNAFSIRLRPKRVKVLENEETGRIEEFQILSMELFEVSVVGLPMNAKCAVTDVIGKSFRRSISKLNKTKRSSVVNKNKKSKKSKNKSAGRLSAADVQQMIAKANTPILEALKALAEPASQKKSKKTSKKKSEKTAPVDPMFEMLKEMKETNAALVKSLKRSNRRKGLQDDGNNNSGVPAKVLEGADDPDTVKFVHYVCNHEKAYDDLTDDEKILAKGYYIQLMDASQSA